MNPLVSVIIPTYKRSDTLPRAIDSALRQTYSNIEIIVVDDNGEGTEYQKATEQRLKGYIESGKITYIKHKVNKNGSAARNTGFRASKGEYINFLDDDDILYRNNIQKQLKRLQSTPDYIGASYCNTMLKRRQNLTHKIKKYVSKNIKEGNICYEYLMGICSFNTSTILFKRIAVEKNNGFDETYQRHQDTEFMIRFFRHFKIVCSGLEPLVQNDLTDSHRYKPNGKFDFILKEKFIKEFEDDFEKTGKGNIIRWWFWYQCCQTQLLSKDFCLFVKAYKKASRNKPFTIKESLCLVKIFCVSFLKI